MENFLSLFNSNHHHELIRLFKESEITPESDPFSSQIVAASFFRIGDFSSAYELLCKLYHCFADNVDFLSLYAATCRNLGRLDDSKDLFKKALSLDPDNAGLQNNYSNLLVDLGLYSDAIQILEKLVVDHPAYEDAKSNLNRTRALIESSKSLSSTTSATSLSTGHHIDSHFNSASSKEKSFLDPLMFAFTQEEVVRTAPFRPSLPSSGSSASAADLDSQLPVISNDLVASDQLNLAYKSISEGNPRYALKLCSHAIRSIPNNPEVYSCIGDAYIALQWFAQAESAILHALILGSPSFKHYFNLATIASLKKNLSMANYYLDRAASLDSSNPNIIQMRTTVKDLSVKTPADHISNFSLEHPFSNVEK